MNREDIIAKTVDYILSHEDGSRMLVINAIRESCPECSEELCYELVYAVEQAVKDKGAVLDYSEYGYVDDDIAYHMPFTLKRFNSKNAFITNFQSPVEYADLVERCDEGRGTSLDILLSDSNDDYTVWTVSKDAQPGDTVVFMCAKTSKDHMGHVCSVARKEGNERYLEYAEEKRALYKQYAGSIVAVGRVCSDAFQDRDPSINQYWRSPWYAKIDRVQLLADRVTIDDFRDFIKVSRTGAITKLTDEQWLELKGMILERNKDLTI